MVSGFASWVKVDSAESVVRSSDLATESAGAFIRFKVDSRKEVWAASLLDVAVSS